MLGRQWPINHSVAELAYAGCEVVVVTRVWLIVSIVLLTCCCAAETDISMMGVVNFTKTSAGQFRSGYWYDNYGLFDVPQSSKSAAGASFEIRRWWGRNAAAFTYTTTPTDSKLLGPWGVCQWGIRRHEFNVAWVRRFRAGQRTAPYIKAGVGEVLLNGGTDSGLDHQFQVIAESGVETRIARSFSIRGGVSLHFLRASNYSDPEYRGSGTLMVEPSFGLVWHLGAGHRSE